MNPVTKLFALFCALALLLPACVTVRDCDGKRYRALKIKKGKIIACKSMTPEDLNANRSITKFCIETEKKSTAIAVLFFSLQPKAI